MSTLPFPAQVGPWHQRRINGSFRPSPRAVLLATLIVWLGLRVGDVIESVDIQGRSYLSLRFALFNKAVFGAEHEPRCISLEVALRYYPAVEELATEVE